MKEAIIKVEISPSYDSKSKLGKINKAFVSGAENTKDKDHLTQAHIEEMAQVVADYIEERLGALKDTDEQVETVIHILQPSQILYDPSILKAAGVSVEMSHPDDPLSSVRLGWKDEKGILQTDTITRQELEPFLQKIRLAILRELPKRLPKNVVARMAKRGLENRVLELEDDKFYKDRLERVDLELTDRENKNMIEAYKLLHSIPEKERSPFVFFGTEVIDPKSGRTISKAIENLPNIEKVLDQEEKPELSKILGYFIEAVKGHRFLISHDLILSDNHLGNIGINKDGDKGFLSDLDGLRRKNDPMKYIAAAGFMPPERANDPDSPATEANIVFELGVGLEKIKDVYDRQPEIPPARLADLLALSKEMTDWDPQKRPALAQIEERLKAIKDSLNLHSR